MAQLTVAEKKRLLEENFDTAIAALVSDEVSSYPFTVTGNTLNVSDNDFVNGCVVRVNNSGGGLPDGLDNSQVYFVVNRTSTTVQLSKEVNGSPVEITSIGSGTHTVTEQPLIETLKNHEIGLTPIWVRHEIMDYSGTGRQTLNFPTPLVDLISQTATIPSTELIFSPLTSINYRYLILLRGGNTTQGDTTGEILAVIDDGVSVINIDGKIFNIGAISL